MLNNPVNFSDPLGLATFHFWPPRPGYVGHVSMHLDDGTYVSNWPFDNSLFTPNRFPSFADDIKDERREPFSFPINLWFGDFKRRIQELKKWVIMTDVSPLRFKREYKHFLHQ